MKRFVFLFFLLCPGFCLAQNRVPFSNALIVYMSKHGTTEKVAGMIKDSLGIPTTVVNLKKERNPETGPYDLILIGGSFHVGKIQKQVRNFCRRNETVLLTKNLGIFVCCMFTGNERQEEFNRAFSENLRKHASVKGFMGYELLFEKMDPVTRKIMKKMSGETKDVYKVDTSAIQRFVTELKKQE
jgi:menaquinone-dependent protoporphyrinogen oxidase